MAVEIIAGQITVEIGSLVGPQGPAGKISTINSISPNSPAENIDVVADGASAITVTSDDPSDTVTVGETHSPRVDNPHGVTAAQAGADPAGSAAAVASDLGDHEADTANPHSATFTQAVAADAGTDITAAEAETLTDGSLADALHTHAPIVGADHGSLAGLPDDDHLQYLTEARHDALPADNPHSVTAVQAGADPAGSAAAVAGDLSTHEADVANPHAVTAAQAGADPAGSAAAVASDLNDHELDVGNPHAVTAAQAGAEPANANIQGHIIDTTNPHGVTAAQAGATPAAHATDTANPHAVTAVQAGADPAGSAAAVAGDLSTHEADVANPHAVTAAQAGADPAGSAAAVAGDLSTHEGDSGNPHGVTFTQASAADGGTDISAAEAETLTDGSIADALHTHAGVGGNSLQATWRFSTSTADADPGSGRFRYDNVLPASVTELYVDDVTQNGFNAATILGGLDVGAEIYIQQADNPLLFLLVTLTGAVIDNTGYFTLPVTVDDSGLLPGNNKDCGFIIFTFGEPALAVHVADLGNPHAVTAAQAGADPAGSAAVVAGALVTHESDTGNPHSVTAAQAGATPAAHASDTANPHAVTFTQAVTADAGTDITPAEAETLTDGSDADALHSHPAVEAAAAGPYLLTGQWGQVASTMDNKVSVLGTGLMADAVLTADADALTVDADGTGIELDSDAAAGNDTSVRAGAANGTRLDQLPIFTTRFKLNATTNRRFFGGLAPLASIPTDDNNLDGAEGVGVIYSSDRPDTNFQFAAHDGTSQTLVDTGVAVDTAVHHVEIVAATAASVTVRLLDADGVEEATTTFTTELPAGTVAMIPSATLTAVTAAVQTWTFYSMSVIVP